jgi:ATP:ADP antiporter, AAA family
MLPKPLRLLWGDLTREEVEKFGILAFSFFLIIGVYWMLRVMKNEMFDTFVGYKQYQPTAKWISVICVALLITFYSKLVDLLKKEVLFYLVFLFYGLGFIILAYGMAHPQLVSISPSSALYPYFSWIPGKVGAGLGWFSFFFLESFGSIGVALFWALVASTTSTASAKRGYGMVSSVTQIGTFLGPIIVFNFANIDKPSLYLGFPILFGIGGLIICLVPLLIRYYVTHIPADHVEEGKRAGKKTGFFEGLRLLLSKPYLMGILVVVTMYEVVSTIVEYQMNTLASDSGISLAAIGSHAGMYIGAISFVFALFGTSFFMRVFGLKFCLIAFPSLIGLTVLTDYILYLNHATPIVLMWAFFYSVVIFKAFCYALNNPVKEVLYIPTSKDVKFKAKGWIDAFGNRTAKASGALVTDHLKYSFEALIAAGTFISLGITGFWILVAIFVATKFDTLQESDTIIE